MALSRTTIAGLAAVVILAAAAYAYFVEPNRLVAARSEIAIANWNPMFDGLKIAAVSDIHAGSNGSDVDKLRRIVEMINAEEVDLAVFLGDYVVRKPGSEHALMIAPDTIADALSGIKANFGVYFVLGNQDQNTPGAEMAIAFERVGYKLLNGRVHVIEVDGEKLRLLGLKDHLSIGVWKEYSDDAKRLLAPTEGQGDVIVLQHSPDVLPIITGQLSISPSTKLMLAGHTHGGQIRFPVLGAPIVPSMFGQKYAYGHVRENGVHMYVTSGIGTSKLPFRFMAPPEVAFITVRRKMP